MKYPAWYSNPTPTTGTPMSDAVFKWSPARIPSPPEYCGSADVMPYSALKYATAAGASSPCVRWYHWGSVR